MYEYDIPDMSCGHCVATVTKAVKTADPEATVEIDLAARKASVISTRDPQAIATVLGEADYPATYRVM